MAEFSQLSLARDRWTIACTGDEGEHISSLFALGNGWIGIRAQCPSDAGPRIFLNGVHDVVPIEYHEGAHGLPRHGDVRFPVADATRCPVAIDGKQLTLPGAMTLDMRNGLLKRSLSHEGAKITSTQFVSMARIGVVVTRIGIKASRAVHIAVESPIDAPATAMAEGEIYDPRITHSTVNPWKEQDIPAGGAPARADRLEGSGWTVAAVRSDPSEMELSAGQEASILCVTVYCADNSEGPATLASRARAQLAEAQAIGFDALLAEHAAFWAEAWAGCEFALADERTEAALRHGMFQLIQAARRDGKGSVSAKGQTGEGYEGHVFWDAESYALPSLIFTNPDIARAALRWRISGLEAARANARALGHERGALLPWRTIAGRECSSYFLAGSAQYHINADVAHALRLYVETTGDTALLRDGGAELLAETARIWLDLGWHDPARGGFVINRVTGPDEYTALVDNNLYTNIMAAEHMRLAATLAERYGVDPGLSPDERSAMLAAADAMVLPFDDMRQVYAQDDAFFAKQPWPIAQTPAEKFPLLLHYHPLAIYRHCVAKQADAVLAMALWRDRFDAGMRQRMLDIYEPLTVHDSTLSASSFAIAAAAAGDMAKAYRYWSVTVLTDLLNLFGNTDHGLHMAALGGGWNGLAFGFAGLDTCAGALSFAPAHVPALGDYAFTIRYRGRSVTLNVAGNVARYTVRGEPLELLHHGEPVLVGAEPVERALRA